MRAHAKYCYSINDLITYFLSVTAKDFNKFREQHLIFGLTTAPPMPATNLSAASNLSYQPAALFKKGIKRDAILFNSLKENKL